MLITAVFFNYKKHTLKCDSMEPYIEINTKAVVENYKKLREFTNKNIIAVIKDNAYGHSLIQIGKTLSNNNVFMLAVSSLTEAITLRKSMIFSPLLLLGRCDDARTIYSLKITQGVSSLDQLKKISQSNFPIAIHLEIETGMHRLGLDESELEEALYLINNSNLKLKGIYTHFCSTNYTNQEEKFESIYKKYFKDSKLIVHTQASNYINNNIYFCNALRIGLALYGYSPYLKLTPCLKLVVPIIRVQKIKKDELVGYDFIDKTSEDGYIITIPFGYSHGLSRLSKLCFSHHNNTFYQIGKPCMDITMFFSLEKLSSGTEVEIISPQNINTLIAINKENMYYILSSLSPNIKRSFK